MKTIIPPRGKPQDCGLLRVSVNKAASVSEDAYVVSFSHTQPFMLPGTQTNQRHKVECNAFIMDFIYTHNACDAAETNKQVWTDCKKCACVKKETQSVSFLICLQHSHPCCCLNKIQDIVLAAAVLTGNFFGVPQIPSSPSLFPVLSYFFALFKVQCPHLEGHSWMSLS